MREGKKEEDAALRHVRMSAVKADVEGPAQELEVISISWNRDPRSPPGASLPYSE